jgi:hypothetical protein
VGPTMLGTIEPVYFPRGVAAPDHSAGFCADGLGGIVAIALDVGAPRWQTTHASAPLIVVGERLVASQLDPGAPATLRIVVLDAAFGGQPLLVSEPVALPTWVTASGHGQDGLALDARVQGDDLVVWWEARARYRGGAAPPPYVQSRAEHHEAGVVAVDLTRGHVRPIQDESVARQSGWT